MEKIVIELSQEEKKALQELALKSKRTLEETVVRLILVNLMEKGLLNESAERNGSKFVRLDERIL